MTRTAAVRPTKVQSNASQRQKTSQASASSSTQSSSPTAATGKRGSRRSSGNRGKFVGGEQARGADQDPAKLRELQANAAERRLKESADANREQNEP
eukprot:ANDGO_05201.mRNA.1 hypothetical protein